jgi:hypothetical protein
MSRAAGKFFLASGALRVGEIGVVIPAAPEDRRK